MNAIAPQIITTPAGERLVVLPEAEYQRLVSLASNSEEEEADAAIYATRKAALLAGIDERLPPEVTADILQGDTLLKALRKWRGETQMNMNFKTNLSQGFISELESGRKVGTPETLRKIAEFLNVDPSWLIPADKLGAE